MREDKLTTLEIFFQRGRDIKIQRANEIQKKREESPICSAPNRKLCFYKYKYKGIKRCREKIGDCKYQYNLHQ